MTSFLPYLFLFFGLLYCPFSNHVKKSKTMKISNSPEEFCTKYNIPSSIKLCFVEDSEVDLAIGSFDEGEMLLPKGYFEVGLRLPLPPLFREIVIYLELVPNQLCINIMRLIMALVLDHMKILGITVNGVLYIYTTKTSQNPQEWYLSLCLGMINFITDALSTNKDLENGLVVVSGGWEFGATEPEGLPRVTRAHGSAGELS